MKLPSHPASVVTKLLVWLACGYAMCAHCQEAPGVDEPVPAAASIAVQARAEPTQAEPIDGAAYAATAAVADGLSTGIALSAGAIEMNPLVPTSPLGLILITGLKIGVAKFAETLPEAEKRLTLKTTAAAWGGAAVNNLLLCFAVPGPIAVLVGLAAGIATWYRMERAYRHHDRLLAAQAARPGLDAPAATAVAPGQGPGVLDMQALHVQH
ncbi:MAG: hypothetical protein V4857_20370 [Pseudomonadota bacterium]